MRFGWPTSVSRQVPAERVKLRSQHATVLERPFAVLGLEKTALTEGFLVLSAIVILLDCGSRGG